MKSKFRTEIRQFLQQIEINVVYFSQLVVVFNYYLSHYYIIYTHTHTHTKTVYRLNSNVFNLIKRFIIILLLIKFN